MCRRRLRRARDTSFQEQVLRDSRVLLAHANHPAGRRLPAAAVHSTTSADGRRSAVSSSSPSVTTWSFPTGDHIN